MPRFNRVLIVSGSKKEQKKKFRLIQSSGTRRHLIYSFHSPSGSSQITALVPQGSSVRSEAWEKRHDALALKTTVDWQVMRKLPISRGIWEDNQCRSEEEIHESSAIHLLLFQEGRGRGQRWDQNLVCQIIFHLDPLRNELPPNVFKGNTSF